MSEKKLIIAIMEYDSETDEWQQLTGQPIAPTDDGFRAGAEPLPEWASKAIEEHLQPKPRWRYVEGEDSVFVRYGTHDAATLVFTLHFFDFGQPGEAIQAASYIVNRLNTTNSSGPEKT